jgi:3-dehydroquinate dehydratase-2
MAKFLVIHGPNLGLLGARRPDIYGRLSLPAINRKIEAYARSKKIKVRIVQSDCEGGIIEAIHQARGFDGLVINPAGYTHSSVAIRDAVEASGLNTVEVHLSNISAREEFRRRSLIAPVCRGQISGLGWTGYTLALEYLRGLTKTSAAEKEDRR